MVALTLVVSACGGSGTDTTSATITTAAPQSTTTAGAETTAPPETTAAPSGEPIVVGSTLSLTGAFGPTGVIHQIAGELFMDRLNEAGGLLGQPVEWDAMVARR